MLSLLIDLKNIIIFIIMFLLTSLR